MPVERKDSIEKDTGLMLGQLRRRWPHGRIQGRGVVTLRMFPKMPFLKFRGHYYRMVVMNPPPLSSLSGYGPGTNIRRTNPTCRFVLLVDFYR